MALFCTLIPLCVICHILIRLEIFAVGLGRSTVSISSSIIGIFHLNFFTIENGQRADVQLEEDVEIVIGRDKVSTFPLFR